MGLCATLLIGPYVVDWNAYSASLEKYGKALFGHRVNVGQLDFRLLPTPALTVNDVRIGSGEKPILRAQKILLKVELPPLLRGKIQVSELTVIAPQLNISLDESGRLDLLTDMGHGSGAALLEAENIYLRNVQVQNGSVELTDSRTEMPFKARQLDIEMSARSLTGPYKISGAGMSGQSRVEFRIRTGTYEAEANLPLFLQFTLPDMDMRFEAEGGLLNEAGFLDYRGAFKLLPLPRTGAPADMPADMQDNIAENQPGGDGDGDDNGNDNGLGQAWQMAGQFVANPDRIIWNKTQLQSAAAAAAFISDMSGNIQFEKISSDNSKRGCAANALIMAQAKTTRAQLQRQNHAICMITQITGAKVDLNRYARHSPGSGNRDAAAIAKLGAFKLLYQAASDLMDRLAGFPSPSFPWRFSFLDAQIIAGQGMVHKMDFDTEFVAIDGENSRHEGRIVADLPGKGQISVMGNWSAERERKFAAKIALAGDDIGPLVKWLGPADLERIPTGAISIKTDIYATRKKLSLGDTRFEGAGSSLSGNLSWTSETEGRPGIVANIQAKRVDAEGLQQMMQPFTFLFEKAAGNGEDAFLALLSPAQLLRLIGDDGSLELHIDQLRLAQSDIEGLDVSVKADRTNLSLTRFEIKDFGGINFQSRGNIQISAGQPVGNLTANFGAKRAAPLWELLSKILPAKILPANMLPANMLRENWKKESYQERMAGLFPANFRLQFDSKNGLSPTLELTGDAADFALKSRAEFGQLVDQSAISGEQNLSVADILWRDFFSPGGIAVRQRMQEAFRALDASLTIGNAEPILNLIDMPLLSSLQSTGPAANNRLPTHLPTNLSMRINKAESDAFNLRVRASNDAFSLLSVGVFNPDHLFNHDHNEGGRPARASGFTSQMIQLAEQLQYAGDFEFKMNEAADFPPLFGLAPERDAADGPLYISSKLLPMPGKIKFDHISGNYGQATFVGGVELSVDPLLQRPVIAGRLSLGDIKFSTLAALAAGPLSLSASSPGWQHEAYADPILPGLDIDIELATRRLQFFGNRQFSEFSARLMREGGQLKINDASGEFMGGMLQADLNLARFDDGKLSLTGQFDLRQLDLSQVRLPNASQTALRGWGDLSGKFSSLGQSTKMLIGQLEGQGVINVNSAVLAEFNPLVFNRLIEDVDADPLMDDQRLGDVFSQRLTEGDFTLRNVTIPFVVEAGSVLASRIRVRSGEAKIGLRARFDLDNGSYSANAILSGAPLGPGDNRAAPSVILGYSGTGENHVRKIDIDPLRDYLNFRNAEIQLEKYKELEQQIEHELEETESLSGPVEEDNVKQQYEAPRLPN